MIQANRHLLLPLYQETIFYTADKYSKNVKRIRSFSCLKLFSGLPEQHSRCKPPLFHGLQGPCDLTPSGPSTLISHNHLYSRPSLFPHRGLCCPYPHSALLPGSLSWLLLILQVSAPAPLLQRPFLTPCRCSPLHLSLDPITLLFPSRCLLLSETIHSFFVFVAFLHH